MWWMFTQLVVFESLFAAGVRSAAMIGGKDAVRQALRTFGPMCLVQNAVSAGGEGEKALYQRVGDVAVVDVWGPLGATDADVSDDEGRFGTSYASIRRSLHSAASDPEVAATVLRINSPGGAAIGMHPMAAEVFDVAHGGDGVSPTAGSGARGSGKPIVAYADGLMASAALGIGVQANRVYVAPAAITGSIGTIATFWNFSKYLADHGISVHAAKDPEHKDVGSPFREMTESDKARLDGTIKEFSAKFRGDVARGRGVDSEKVDQWVEAGVYVGGQAARAGLADGVLNSVELAVGLASRMAAEKRAGRARAF